MDKRPEDLQFMSILGFLKEPFKILRSHGILFTSITITLILPLCFIILAHNLATEPLMNKIALNVLIVSDLPGTTAAAKSQKELSEEWIKLGLTFAGYFIFVLAFSLLSTAAIVYSVACIYTDKALSYMKVLSVVPKVWKRLIVTFLWSFILMLGSIVAFLLFLGVVFMIFSSASNVVLYSILPWLAKIGFFGMLIYINCIWQLASVISVLEESYGFGALGRSVHLIKGNNVMAFGVFGIYFLCTFLVGLVFDSVVVHGQSHSIGSVARVIYGLLFVLLLTFLALLGMLLQTVFYFVCKSYHHENIDRGQLSEHLGVYMGEYVPLKNSIQMEQLEV